MMRGLVHMLFCMLMICQLIHDCNLLFLEFCERERRASRTASMGQGLSPGRRHQRANAKSGIDMDAIAAQMPGMMEGKDGWVHSRQEGVHCNII